MRSTDTIIERYIPIDIRPDDVGAIEGDGGISPGGGIGSGDGGTVFLEGARD